MGVRSRRLPSDRAQSCRRERAILPGGGQGWLPRRGHHALLPAQAQRRLVGCRATRCDQPGRLNWVECITGGGAARRGPPCLTIEGGPPLASPLLRERLELGHSHGQRLRTPGRAVGVSARVGVLLTRVARRAAALVGPCSPATGLPSEAPSDG